MEVTFDKLSETARIWIYQSERILTKTEVEIISKSLSSFLQQWTAHGASLLASFDIRYDQFIIVGLDEHSVGASGCSIDAMVRQLQTLSAQIKADFFNRDLIGFKTDNGVVLVKRGNVKSYLSDNGSDVLTFNNLVLTKGELTSKWLIPAKDTWLNRYLIKTTV